MPSIMIHEVIAIELAKKYQNLDNSNFYLGVLAPDAVNINGLAPKDIRWYSHLRNADLDTWLDNVKRFYEEKRNNYNKYFLFGYLTHIVTDIIYDKYFYKTTIEKILKEDISREDAHNVLIDAMNEFTYHEEVRDYLAKVKDELKNVKTYSIRNIDSDTLNKWKSTWYKKPVNKMRRTIYIELNDIFPIVEKVEQELKEYIKII